MNRFEKTLQLNFDEKSDLLFKKLYYILVIIINLEGEELISIVNVINKATQINKKTCYHYINKLESLKLIKKEDHYGRRILKVPEQAKQQIYKYIISDKSYFLKTKTSKISS